MKILIQLFLLGIFSSQSLATRPDIDTVSILGLTPGISGKMVGSHINANLDTLLWDDNSGIGIIKFTGNYLGSKGEFRIAYDKGFVSQISFVAPTHNQEETKKIYGQISEELTVIYGTPDIETKDVTQEMRWEGIKQSISVKAVDQSQYVTIALSKFGNN